jgi:hypothetical protein
MKRIRSIVHGFVLALALIPLFSVPGRAASQDELLEKIKLLEVQIQELKQLKEQQRLSAEKEQHCFTAVGDKKFCNCLAAALPVEVSFERYVHFVVSTADELRYDSLKPEERKGIDGARAAREKCVSKGFFK